MDISATLDRVLSRYADLGRSLAAGPGNDARQFGQLSKEYSDMGPVVEAIEALKKVRHEIDDLEAIISDKSADKEMRELAEAEHLELKGKLPDLERRVQLMLLPKDEADAKNAILEVRAGTGGEEAALFAAELFRMYQRYAALKGWKFEVLSVNDEAAAQYRAGKKQTFGFLVGQVMKKSGGKANPKLASDLVKRALES